MVVVLILSCSLCGYCHGESITQKGLFVWCPMLNSCQQEMLKKGERILNRQMWGNLCVPFSVFLPLALILISSCKKQLKSRSRRLTHHLKFFIIICINSGFLTTIYLFSHLSKNLQCYNILCGAFGAG